MSDRQHNQLPPHRQIQSGNTYGRAFSRADYDPVRHYRPAWYRRPDAVIEVFGCVGILLVIAAIYWGWI